MRAALIAFVLCGLATLLAVNIHKAPLAKANLETVNFDARFLNALQDLESAKPAALTEADLMRAIQKEVKP